MSQSSEPSSSSSVTAILEAAERLGTPELREFVAGALALRARREAPVMSASETTLLYQINQGLPETLSRRLDELAEKRRDETLTPEELTEITRLAEEVEQREVDRLEALTELAALRRTFLPALMQGLVLADPAAHG
jgi:hypothetical protein